MIFRGKDYDFSIFDADCAGRYEQATRALQQASRPVPGEGAGQLVARMCAAAEAFFDTALGPGAAQAVLGGRRDLLLSLRALQDFLGCVRAEQALLAELEAQ